jgi:hypothetical protein
MAPRLQRNKGDRRLNLCSLWHIPSLLIAIVWVLLTQAAVLANLPNSSAEASSTGAELLAARLEEQGTSIQLNGRKIPSLWGRWRTANKNRIGISDTTFIRAFGFELLRNSSLQEQPIHWFSQSQTALLRLPTRLINQARLLDITDLTQRFGWQMQVKQGVLQIQTPLAKVVAARYGQQSWGDRLVIELDRPATWQIESQPEGSALILDAQLTPELLADFKPQLSDAVRAINFEPNGNQTRLTIDTSLPIRAWSLANPNRLVIDIRPDALVERDIVWAPGVRWRSQLVTLGSDRFPVTWLEVNPRQVGLQLTPITPSSITLTGIAPLAETARASEAAAAINAGFFNRNNQLPLGAVRANGRWRSGPILGRGAIAWNRSTIQFSRLGLQETLTLPKGQLPLTQLNSAYIRAGVARYTPDWGNTYLTLANNEIVATVQNNRVIAQQTIETAGTSVSIPVDGYLLVARAYSNAATLLAIGTPVRVESVLTPANFSQYPNILGAGPLLVQNHQIVLDAVGEGFSPAFANERAIRSAIAHTDTGNLLLVTIHNRVAGLGPTLGETAQLLRQLRAIEALNLDGGSSTTLFLGGQVIDRPPNTTARVHNGIGLFIQPNP